MPHHALSRHPTHHATRHATPHTPHHHDPHNPHRDRLFFSFSFGVEILNECLPLCASQPGHLPTLGNQNGAVPSGLPVRTRVQRCRGKLLLCIAVVSASQAVVMCKACPSLSASWCAPWSSRVCVWRVPLLRSTRITPPHDRPSRCRATSTVPRLVASCTPSFPWPWPTAAHACPSPRLPRARIVSGSRHPDQGKQQRERHGQGTEACARNQALVPG